jgi:DNA-binding CsgD family transcriptional regulator/tetratricopeptide (TPR) repeat protein
LRAVLVTVAKVRAGSRRRIDHIPSRIPGLRDRGLRLAIRRPRRLKAYDRSVLIGRDPETRLIEGLLEDARNGTSAALLIRGEAGMGKTAVLEQLAEGSSMRTLRCAGVQSEHDLPFAGLEQLFRPLHDLFERLPDPQASALGSAFGLASNPVDDRLLLGVATLSLLAEAAEDAPLLCLVDDLQWLDGPSAQALLFAARRLDAEGVVMLFAVRDDPADWFEAPGLPHLTLAPLAESASRELVARRLGTALSQAAQEQLLREAAGNPLALLELPVHELGGGEPTGVEAAFRARVLRLPDESRRLLVLAVAMNSEEAGSWTELGRLAQVSPTARRPAVDAGLVGEVDAIVFRHPLVRSAVFNTASPAARAEAHRLLAVSATDSLMRASHLAAAAQEPDEGLAAELEQAAAAATRRGAFASAAGVLVRAADLSTDLDGRARRLIAAAQAYLEAGDADASSRIADRALACARTVPDQAALTAVKSGLELQRGTPGVAYDLLVAAARSVSQLDPARALDLQAQAIVASFVAGWPERAFAEAREFLEDLPSTGTPYERFLRFSLEAITTTGETRKAARDKLLQELELGTAARDFRIAACAGIVGVYLGEVARTHELIARAVASARLAGSFNVLPQALLGLARLNVFTRNFGEAEECATEGIEITRQFGQQNQETGFSAMLVRCLAARGDIAKCRVLAEATLRRALAHGISSAADDVRLGLAELEILLGHGASALELIEAISQPLLRLVAVPYLVEASVLAPDSDPPLAAVDVLAAYAEQSRDPLVLGVVARSRARLATSGEVAESLFLEALRHHTEHTNPFERAWTALAYGEFLRRAQRKRDARVQLRDALTTFEGLNALLWAERARSELAASGITARRRDPATVDTLTPQELRIAKLVASGASNRAVASQLFLSPKTVEYHLRKVFLKTGVASRIELAHLPLAAVAVGATAQ